ncbi:kinase-like protein [Daldinia grandis]|nr:kinase-like protein [Daldinia grandis]
MSTVSQTTACPHRAEELPDATLDTGLSDEVIEYQPFDDRPDLENLQMYNKGGHHPVHLDDLGSGGFGIVWLCRDIEINKWRAVKVIAADRPSNSTEEKIFDYLRDQYDPEELEEKHILLPLQQFWLKGPNGWNVSNWRLLQTDYESQTDSMHLLHRNILMKIEGIDDLDVDQLLDIIGEPECAYIRTVSGQPLTPRAPEYCVVPADEFWCKKLTTNSIAIIDFGESFFVQNPPTSTGIPNLYAAPEVMFQGTGILGFHSDLWALACTLYEVRTGSPLFVDLFGPDLRGTIKKIESFLGPLPQQYQTTYMKMLHGIPRVSEPDISGSTSQSDKQTTSSKTGPRSGTLDLDKSIKSSTDAFEATLRRERRRYKKTIPGQQRQPIKYQYPEEDALGLADLLGKLVKYDPAERINIDAVMSHPWISGCWKAFTVILGPGLSSS